MPIRTAIIALISTTALLLGLAGCAADMAARSKLERKLPAGSRVAVLPFENLSGFDKAAEKVTDLFQTDLLASDRVDAVEYGMLYEGLRRYRIRSATRITGQQIDSLAVHVNADYLLVGSVLEYKERDDRFLGVVPTVSFTCRLISCSTGESVWVATNNGRGNKGEIIFGIGAIRSADKLASEMVTQTTHELLDLFQKP
jgi:TolB-like protein